VPPNAKLHSAARMRPSLASTVDRMTETESLFPEAINYFCNKIFQFRTHAPHTYRPSFDQLIGKNVKLRRDCNSSALTVFRLITKRYFIGCSIGKSLGF
jgi:hypothetical protein